MKFPFLTPWNWFANEGGGPALQPSSAENQVKRTSFDLLSNDIDKLFYNMVHDFLPIRNEALRNRLTSGSGSVEGSIRPKVDISATDTEYTVSAELPGISDSDIKVDLRNGALIISGEKKIEKEDKDKGFYRMERSYGSFQRVLAVPEDADVDNIKATHKDGVLKVSIPRKALAQSEAKSIAIAKE